MRSQLFSKLFIVAILSFTTIFVDTNAKREKRKSSGCLTMFRIVKNRTSLNTDFLLAAKYGDLDKINSLLKKNCNINTVDQDGCTALMLAARSNHASVVNYLLVGGADINLANNCGDTALIEAARYGHLNIVKIILTKDVHTNAANKSGCTALMKAAEKGHVNIVRALLIKGTDVNAVDNNGWSACMYAANNGHTDVVERLLTMRPHVSEDFKSSHPEIDSILTGYRKTQLSNLNLELEDNASYRSAIFV